MKRFKSVILILLFLLISANYAFGLGIEAAIGVWNQEPTGDLSYKGDNLNIENELNYSKENRFLGRLKIDMPLFIPNIYFMYTPMRFKGHGVKDVNFKFGDVVFNANVPFYSKAKLDHYDITLFYGLPFVKTATLNKLNIEVGLNIRIIDFYAKIEQKDLNLSEDKDATIPIPMGYVGFQLKPVKYLHIEAEAKGIAYNGSSYFDLIGRVKVFPFCPMFFVSGGYRLESINIDYADVDSDIRFKGPFIEVGMSF